MHIPMPSEESPDYLAQVLMLPIQHWNRHSDGIISKTGINFEAMTSTLCDSLILFKQARIEATDGMAKDGDRLTPTHFERALEHMRQEDFLKLGIENNVLERCYLAFRADPKQFSRDENKNIRVKFRGAFRNWITKLVGEWPFFLTVLRHGLFEAADHKKLAQAILDEKGTNAGSEDSGDSHPTAAMRLQAVQARQDVKKA